jgi:hypothetical protein
MLSGDNGIVEGRNRIVEAGDRMNSRAERRVTGRSVGFCGFGGRSGSDTEESIC